MAQVPKCHVKAFWYSSPLDLGGAAVATAIEAWLNGLGVTIALIVTHPIGVTGCLVIVREG